MNPERIETLFHRNFDEREELGASLSIWKDGGEILSLHHGWRDREQTRPWNAETLAPVWSATKGPAALATLLALHEAGIGIQDRVSSLWPELRAARDSRLTFAGLLSHQSGLPALDSGNRPDMLSHRAVVSALENQAPFWEPGKAHGYHPRTYGFLLEEVVTRASGGLSLGRFWNEKIAAPLRIPLKIGGLSAAEAGEIATMVPPRVLRPPEEELPFYRAIAQPGSLAAAAFASPGGMKALGDINRMEYLQAGLPALGGVSSAAGLAKFYHLLAADGFLDGVRAIPRAVVEAFRSLQSSGHDETFCLPTAFTCGAMRDPLDPAGEKIRHLFGPSLIAFGQPGAGGSHAFGDPENAISFAYVMNRMETGVLPNRKSLDLVEALYEFL